MAMFSIAIRWARYSAATTFQPFQPSLFPLMADVPAKKPSAVETFKSESNYLRGTIEQELTDGTSAFSKGNVQLLKHHGTYQQDDRERAHGPRRRGQERQSLMFMVRSRVPGGKLTSEQLLAEFDLCDEVGNGTLRITSRQGLQLHGVLKHDLHADDPPHQRDASSRRLAACGDVERNVMCCPAPHRQDPVHDELQNLADRLAAHLAPHTRAYHEIWLTRSGHRRRPSRGRQRPSRPVEPIYGPTYLPRKFKTAIALPGDNCIDVYANDLGLLAICENYRIVGYNVLVGGGMGVTPSAAKSFPAVAQRMAFVRPDQVIDVATEVIKVQRDFGNRSDRKVARLKYLIHNWGLEAFKAKVEEYYGHKLPDPHPDDVRGFDDHLGWHEQGDGRWFYGLNVENGRIQDTDGYRLKTALREICREYRPGIRLTGASKPALHRHPAGRSQRHRGNSAAARREALARNLDAPPLVDGLRRLADLRPGDHRGRTGAARHDRST